MNSFIAFIVNILSILVSVFLVSLINERCNFHISCSIFSYDLKHKRASLGVKQKTMKFVDRRLFSHNLKSRIKLMG